MRKPLLLCSLLLIVSAVSQGRTREHDYALILQEQAVARKTSSRAMLRSAAAVSQLARVEAAQKSVSAELARRNVRVTGSVQLLLNAVFVRATRQQAEALSGLPGVLRVAYLPPIHMNMNTAVDVVNATAAWNAAGGVENAGAGVKIAIIDSGIDHTHPAFQDSGLQAPSGFPKGETAYTNGKIIVARSWVSQLPFADLDPRDSKPDDVTPRDHFGHGTAIAAIAAGVRNTGPAATITGIAPKAWLGNYKIIGSPGVNDTTRAPVLIQALEAALDDGMDIATLSIGDPAVYGALQRETFCSDVAGQLGACDVRAQAVEAAIASGMTVVVSAGNDGAAGNLAPTLSTINTPGTAPSAITVGASTNAHLFYSRVSASGQNFDALFGDGPRPAAPVIAPLRDTGGQYCALPPAGSLQGAVALIERGGCSFIDKVLNAQDAGAVGVVIVNTASNTPIDPVGLLSASIPAAMVGNSAGSALKSLAQAGASVTLDTALHALPDTADVVAGFSSRGPNINDFAIKPELVAPGTGIYTATQNLDTNSQIFDPSRYTGVSSSSFAVPMAAGAAALVKQLNSQFTPAQVKSALVNTANPNVQDAGGQARVAAVGAGRLDVAAARAANATVEPATLGFGVIGTGSLPLTATLTVTNTGSTATTFAVAVTRRDQDSRVGIAVEPSSLQLAAGASGTVSVRLTGTVPAAGSYEGAVTITGGGTTLRVPYLYLVGDGVANNIFPVINGEFTGVINDIDWLIGFKVVDRYGVPVVNAPVQFRVVSGGGRISEGDAATDKLGIAAAWVDLGNVYGDQIFSATAGGLTTEFFGWARPLPAISSGGVVNAASGTVGRGLAPGSYASIFGSGMSDAAKALSTSSLPLSMAGVSVSFDATGISVPGHLSYVGDTQVNVQIPWELRDQSSVQMKVTVWDIPSALYTLQLNPYSPAAFEYTDPGTGGQLAAALDSNYGLLTPANPARRGQTIQIYANGLGPVNPQPASGEPSPGAEPLARTTAAPTITIGGRPAQVLFSGLAPFFVGLYQLNVTVPADAPTGVQPVVISVGGVDSKPVNIPVQ
ncbi:MAG TPA: S8 family serine peptidase [Bryobacteraceae bacterium]|nr:S8 family serine peptidase [Bryobacteraceae bacterium]